MVLLQRKLYFSKDPEGVQHFPVGGGVQLLPGGRGSKGPNIYFYRTHITCDFLGGPSPLSPLWIRT